MSRWLAVGPGGGKRDPVTWTFLVETMGLEPTTPCLESRIGRVGHLHSVGESPGQPPFPLTVATGE